MTDFVKARRLLLEGSRCIADEKVGSEAERGGLNEDMAEAVAELDVADVKLSGLRLKTVEGVLALMRDASSLPDTRAKDTIYPHSNGYGCWFITDDGHYGTAALSAEEILRRIEEREAADG